MVKIPSFARRDDAEVTDENRAATDTTVADDRRTFGRTWADRMRSPVKEPPPGPNAPTEAERRLASTDLSGTSPVEPARPAEPTVDTGPERTPEVPAGPRPRTSVMATLSLIFAIGGAFLVLSGALAGYGIAAGAIAVLLSVGAFAATRKRHVAGKLDAVLGLFIGGAAVVVGILAFTGTFAWPNTDGDWVERLRGWLDSQFVDRF